MAVDDGNCMRGGGDGASGAGSEDGWLWTGSSRPTGKDSEEPQAFGTATNPAREAGLRPAKTNPASRFENTREELAFVRRLRICMRELGRVRTEALRPCDANQNFRKPTFETATQCKTHSLFFVSAYAFWWSSEHASFEPRRPQTSTRTSLSVRGPVPEVRFAAHRLALRRKRKMLVGPMTCFSLQALATA